MKLAVDGEGEGVRVAGTSFDGILGSSTLKPLVARIPNMGSRLSEGSAMFAREKKAFLAEGVSFAMSC